MWRARLLNVLLVALAASSVAAALGPVAHAQSASKAPQPIVVAIDPGHGGVANPANPSQLFDPGAIAANGVEEKDVTLDVGTRLAALLRADEVDAVLSRTDDVYITIAQREQVAVDNHAALFVSIHANSFTDPAVGGSLVLYPNVAAQRFAQTLSNGLGRDLASSQVADDGIQLRDNWWIHAPMPTSTVEMAYLTNPHEAALMSTESFRQQVAMAIRDGIETYDPQIAARRAAIRAWRAQHPGAPIAPPRTRARGAAAASIPSSHSVLGALLFWTVVVGLILAALRWPRITAWLISSLVRLIVRTLRAAILHRRAVRRRRHLRARVASRAPRTSVYDELWL